MRKPMPLSDLPDYVESTRRNGQEDAPVVDMGRIVQRRSAPLGILSYAAAAVVLVGLAGSYVALSTKEIIVNAGGLGIKAVADLVREEGGRVLSVKREENGSYRMRVFTFRRIGSFLEGLKGKNIEIGD